MQKRAKKPNRNHGRAPGQGQMTVSLPESLLLEMDALGKTHEEIGCEYVRSKFVAFIIRDYLDRVYRFPKNRPPNLEFNESPSATKISNLKSDL